jgi:hypothetical protein
MDSLCNYRNRFSTACNSTGRCDPQNICSLRNLHSPIIGLYERLKVRKSKRIGSNHKSQTKNLTKSIYEIETYGDLGLQRKRRHKSTLAYVGYLKTM